MKVPVRAVSTSAKVRAAAPREPKIRIEDLHVAFMHAADRFDAKHGRSKKAALAMLVREGIVTPAGRLTKRYGG